MMRYEEQDHVAVAVARLYSSAHKKPFAVIVGLFGDYDIVSEDNTIRMEVKCETSPERTGNVAIELWNTDLDKASGILGTKANIWIHIVYDGKEWIAYEYDVDVLRKLVIEHGVTRTNGRNALLRIIPLETFRKYAKRYFPFSHPLLVQTLNKN